jgi:hypothetical protein
MKTIRITSEGPIDTVKITDAETGEPIPGVTKATIAVDASGQHHANLQFKNPRLNIVAVAAIDQAPGEAVAVCAQAYQLIGELSHLMPNADQWLDNLWHARLVHKDLITGHPLTTTTA